MPNAKTEIAELMNDLGLDDVSLLTALRDAPDAMLVRNLPTSDGVEVRKVIDHQTRLRAVELCLRPRGHIGPEAQGIGSQEGPPSVTLIFQ